MAAPDFAVRDTARLTEEDLRFLLEHFPAPGASYEEMAQLIHDLPSTVESMLGSAFVFEQIFGDRERFLRVSPFLLFSVLLRRVLPQGRAVEERAVVNYLANLLAVFARTDRLYRVDPADAETFEYLVDMVAEGMESDERRRFLVHAHIGNFSLYLSGLFPEWLDHRHRHARRPTDPAYLSDMGRSYYGEAARHPLARRYRMEDVFLRLALVFDEYRTALNRLSREYLMA